MSSAQRTNPLYPQFVFCSCVACVCYILLTAHYKLLVFAICYLYLQYVAQVCYVYSSCVVHVLLHMLLTTHHVLLMFAQCCSLFVMCCSCLLCVAHCLLVLILYIAQFPLCIANVCVCCSLLIMHTTRGSLLPYVWFCCLHLYITHCSSCVVMSITTIHYN